MPTCSVPGCRKKSGDARKINVQFFSFPRNLEMAQKWVAACNRPNINLKNARICSTHFAPNCFKKKPECLTNCENYSPKRLRTLLDNAVPTENLDYEENQANCYKVKNLNSDYTLKLDVIAEQVKDSFDLCEITGMKITKYNSEPLIQQIRIQQETIKDLQAKLFKSKEENNMLQTKLKQLQTQQMTERKNALTTKVREAPAANYVYILLSEQNSEGED
ncbi:THAP domain-containing protein 1 A-like isoform X1 [Copidosoma floridanum]|uniref:THAP domain-containing protein 1 A-like isoform X1 n=1 Tax=Copidosoma floridanum TaxID=29053 RepID=UPI0006C96124|nr:THAP domain-containing protein 1 A-like isoform X1 [Copidosoma floridanum]